MKIFISYRWADDNENSGVIKTFAKKLIEKYGKANIWFDNKEVDPGDKIGQEIDAGLENSNIFIPIITNRYLEFYDKSEPDWVRYEAFQAIKNQKLIIPMVVGISNKEKTGSKTYIDINKLKETDNENISTLLLDAKGVNTEHISKITGTALTELNNIISNHILIYQHALNKLKEEYNSLEIVGDINDETMDKCYVDPRLKRDDGNNDKLNNKDGYNDKRDEDIIKGTEFLGKDQYSLIIGDGGQGKSTFVKNIYATCAERIINNSIETKFYPLFYSCKWFVENDVDDLLESIAVKNELFNKYILNKLLEKRDKYKPLFIFDGLDEINDGATKELFNRINYCGEITKSYIIFTSRPSNRFLLDQSDLIIGKDIVKYEVQLLNDEEFSAFVEKASNRVKIFNQEDFFDKIKRNEEKIVDYNKLSRNPYVLNILIKLYTKGNLPTTKNEAFDMLVDKFLLSKVRDYKETIKGVLGYIAFETYQARDNNEKDEYNVEYSQIDKVVRCALSCNPLNPPDIPIIQTVKKILEKNKLCGGGVQHELLTAYYASFYCYFDLIDKLEREVVDIELYSYLLCPKTEYWTSVMEFLIYRMSNERRYSHLLEKLVVKMQEFDKPAYDLLCNMLCQFDDTIYVSRAKSIIVTEMFNRGVRGIIDGKIEKGTFVLNCAAYNCANPYDELFYYVVKYDLGEIFKNIIIDSSLDREVAEYLKAELLYILDEVDNKKPKQLSNKEYAEKCRFASSETRKDIHGHVNVNDIDEIIEKQLLFKEIDLISVNIPNGIISIKSYAFSGCSNLKLIKLPYTLEHIHNGAFKGCSALLSINIPSSVTEIYQSAFSGCTGLKEISLPANVKTIGYGVTSGCNNLEKITIDGRNKYYKVVNNCIVTRQNDVKLDEKNADYCSVIVGCKESKIPIDTNIKHIERYAFKDCLGLKEITIPSNIAKIDQAVFSGCRDLECIKVDAGNPNYEVVDNCLIEKDSYSLIATCKDSKIPTDGSIVNIGEGAFAYNTNINEIKIPISVKSIGIAAFFDCNNLHTIKISNNVEDIDDYAFTLCATLENVKMQNSVTRIGRAAFFGCINLKEIKVSNQVTEIEYKVFKDCINLTSIDISNNITRIGYKAFKGCTSLKSIILSKHICEIDDSAFHDCHNLKDIYCDMNQDIFFEKFPFFKEMGVSLHPKSEIPDELKEKL